ncbi:MAG: MOSC domain-containing protein [Cyclobacteriaceae bacterium]|nr:MOSC domain-containing protein [Cyclobacteriaceae bacterium]
MDTYKLEEIWIYPVKSLGGIRLSSAQVMEKGFQYDRRYMLMDENNMFITQRAFPLMSQFKLGNFGESFSVRFEGDIIEIPKNPERTGEHFEATIWDDTVKVAELSKEHSQWFSEKMNLACKLVFFPEENDRLVDQGYATNQEHVSLADGYPFLIIGQRSLDDLNNRLSAPISMKRFRPNLVFSGGKPFAEDSWREFTIGDNRFVNLKLCARCVLTTIDPETGKQGTEPLATLAKFRRIDNKVNFGANLVALDHNIIKEGDKIQVHSTVQLI